MTRIMSRFLLLAGAAGSLAAIAMLSRQRSEMPGRSDDAPGRTARRAHFGGFQVTGRTVTIDAPAADIYRHWREADRLNLILGSEARVERPSPDRFDWIIATPLGEITVETAVIEDRPDEMIAWRSVEGARIDVEAKVQIRPAPAGRGTEVEAHIAWKPPYGMAGYWAAQMRRTDPKTRGKQALKRLKMLLETGEIATADNRRAL